MIDPFQPVQSGVEPMPSEVTQPREFEGGPRGKRAPKPTPAGGFLFGGAQVLGMTGEQAVEAARVLGVPVNTSLPAYKSIFRNGVKAGEEGTRVGVWPFEVTLPQVVKVLREESSEGEVVKFVCRVPRDVGAGPVASGVQRQWLETESVLIPMVGTARGRTYTLCLSSQVGCAMGCTFCETAQMGLIRSLTAAEIVAQWYVARHVIGIAPKNIVFMGMGEPLDNFDNVIQSVAVLKDHYGAAVPVSHITVSTVGRIDGLRRLREVVQQPTWHRLNLALSLNAPNDSVRDGLMPINRKYNISELREELRTWPRFGGNKFCIEYVLIPGVNNSPQHAREIAEFVHPLRTPVREGATGEAEKDTRERAVVNLIPYNPRRNSPWPAPTEDEVDEFIGHLIANRVFVKRRRTKGREMMGACGQLGNQEIRNRREVGPVGLTVSAPNISVT